MTIQRPRFYATACLRRLSSSLLLRYAAVLLLVGAAVASAGADGTPGGVLYIKRPLTAVRLTTGLKPPVIDGDLSDPVWQGAAKAEVFIDPQRGKPATDQTEAYLLYNRDYIDSNFSACISTGLILRFFDADFAPV